MSSYVSARPRATALIVLVIVQLALLAVTLLAWIAGRATLDAELMAAAGWFGIAATVQVIDLLVFIAATVVFLTWVHRSIANLSALNPINCRFAPGEAVWSFFIPFVNLARGYQVVAAIWTESQPITDEASYVAARSAGPVGWWWGVYLFSGVAAFFVPKHPFGVDELKSMASGTIFVLLVRIASALLFLFVVRGAQRRQDEQWLDLERRRAVPQPTAELLR